MLQAWRPGAGCSAIDSARNYFGADHSDKLHLLSRNRDSGLLANSNWDAALALLGERAGVEVASFSHWACGWVETILIDPADEDGVAIAERIQKRLADYPILDEEDYSEREWAEVKDIWKAITPRDRIKRTRPVKAALVRVG